MALMDFETPKRTTAKRLDFDQGSITMLPSGVDSESTPSRATAKQGSTARTVVDESIVAERDALKLEVEDLRRKMKALSETSTREEQGSARSSANANVSNRGLAPRRGAQFDILRWSKERNPEFTTPSATAKMQLQEDHDMQVVEFDDSSNRLARSLSNASDQLVPSSQEDDALSVLPGSQGGVEDGIALFYEANPQVALTMCEDVDPEVQWLVKALEPGLGKGRDALAAVIEDAFAAFLSDRSRAHLSFSSSLFKLARSGHLYENLDRGSDSKELLEFLVRHLISEARYKDEPPHLRPEEDFPVENRWNYVRELATQLGLSLDLTCLICQRHEARFAPDKTLPKEGSQLKEDALARAERYLHALQIDIDRQRDEADERALKENSCPVDGFLNPTCSEFVFEQLLPAYAPQVGFKALRQLVRAGAGLLIENHDEDEVRRAAGMPLRTKKRSRTQKNCAS